MHNGGGSCSREKGIGKEKRIGTHKTKRINGKEKVRTCATSNTASKSQAGPQGKAIANTLYRTDKILPPGG